MMKFEEFDFKRAIKSDKVMEFIAGGVCAVLWTICIIYLAWRM